MHPCFAAIAMPHLLCSTLCITPGVSVCRCGLLPPLCHRESDHGLSPPCQWPLVRLEAVLLQWFTASPEFARLVVLPARSRRFDFLPPPRQRNCTWVLRNELLMAQSWHAHLTTRVPLKDVSFQVPLQSRPSWSIGLLCQEYHSWFCWCCKLPCSVHFGLCS